MLRKFYIVTGIFCLACALIPAGVYGIFNTGVWAFAALGVLILILPKLWDRIRLIKPLRNIFLAVTLLGGIYVTLGSAVMINRAYFSEPPESGGLAVVVLGSKINGDQPSLMLRRRLDEAYDYMLKNDSAVCVVTGGQGPDEIMPEAAAMRNYLIKRGAAPDRVLLEDTSTNTQQNLEFAAKLIPRDYKVIIATDGFHQLRASVFAKAAGLDAPYALSSLTPWGLLPTYWMRELMGLPVAVVLAGN